MQFSIILIFGSLSFLFPDEFAAVNNSIENKSIDLPYGINPDFSVSDKSRIILYNSIDTVSYTGLTTILRYENNNWGFKFAPMLRYGDVNLYPTRKKFGLYGDFLSGSIYYRNDRINIAFGKDIFSIGGAYINNPLLSPNIPLNYISFNYSERKFSFTHIISRLSDYSGPEIAWNDTVTGYLDNIDRYIGIHRLEYRPIPQLAFSFSEVMLIGGKSGFPFELLSPLTVYYVEQFNQGQNTNIFWNFDMRGIWNNFLFYFDFFIDDFQYEEDPWNEQNHFGIYTGLYANNIIHKGSSFKLTYALLTRWAYCNLRIWQRYNDREFPLGSFFGNDYDLINLEFEYPIDVFKIGLGTSFIRKGENSINTSWPVNTELEAGPDNRFSNNNFLSGTVESRLNLFVILKFKELVDIKTGIYHIKNLHHIEGETKTEPSIRFRINYEI